MLAETVLALMLQLGPMPGRSLYSQVEVKPAEPLVALRAFEVDGRKFKAYDHFAPAEDLPLQCQQPRNVACRRPGYHKDIRRWQRPETFAEGLPRYWTIAQAISQQSGDDMIAKLAIVIVRHESGFRRDVHAGENHIPFRYKTRQEDSGASWCLGQIMIGKLPTSKVPWKGYEDTPAANLVGVSMSRTKTCLGVVTDRLADIVKRCARHGGGDVVGCSLTSYAGTSITTKHRLIRARLNSHAKLKKPRKLGKQIRTLLGLKADDD